MLEAARARRRALRRDLPARTACPTGTPALPGLAPGHRDRPADPWDTPEPVDSSAAAIAAQGLLRLGRCLETAGQGAEGRRFVQAGLTVARTLLAPPYLSEQPTHQGLLLHAVYHRPNGWDFVPPGTARALRGVLPVGRLPPAGAGSPRPEARRGRAVLRVLRAGGSSDEEGRARHRWHAGHRPRHRPRPRREGLRPRAERCAGGRPRWPRSSRTCGPSGARSTTSAPTWARGTAASAWSRRCASASAASTSS